MPLVTSVHNANYLRTAIKTHKQKVLALYKRALADLKSWYLPDHAEYQYQAALLRARFEENRNIKDMRLSKKLLQDGEQELWLNEHPQPYRYDYSPGGICFERYYNYPDWHVDLWHPLEKAQYPKYFATREQRKLDYIKMWEAQYGKPAAVDMGVHAHQNYNVEPATVEQQKYGPFVEEVPGADKAASHH